MTERVVLRRRELGPIERLREMDLTIFDGRRRAGLELLLPGPG